MDLCSKESKECVNSKNANWNSFECFFKCELCKVIKKKFLSSKSKNV